MIALLRSGGQTGVDRAALRFGLAHGLAIAGYCPAGYRAEDGVVPEDLQPFLVCTKTAEYDERTRLNVGAADATLVICRGEPVGGTRLTVDEARRAGKAVLVVDPAEPTSAARVRAWLDAHPEWSSLNVAGPRESEQPGIEPAARHLLELALGHTA